MKHFEENPSSTTTYEPGGTAPMGLESKATTIEDPEALEELYKLRGIMSVTGVPSQRDSGRANLSSSGPSGINETTQGGGPTTAYNLTDFLETDNDLGDFGDTKVEPYEEFQNTEQITALDLIDTNQATLGAPLEQQANHDATDHMAAALSGQGSHFFDTLPPQNVPTLTDKVVEGTSNHDNMYHTPSTNGEHAGDHSEANSYEKITLGKQKTAYEIAAEAQEENLRKLGISLAEVRAGIAFDRQQQVVQNNPSGFADTAFSEELERTPHPKKKHLLRSTIISRNINRLTKKIKEKIAHFSHGAIDPRTKMLLDEEVAKRGEREREAEEIQREIWGKNDDEQDKTFLSDQIIEAPLPVTKKKGWFSSVSRIDPATKKHLEEERMAREKASQDEREQVRTLHNKIVGANVQAPQEKKKGWFSTFFTYIQRKNEKFDPVAKREKNEQIENARENEDREWDEYLKDQVEKPLTPRMHKDLQIKIALEKLRQDTYNKRQAVQREAGPKKRSFMDMLDAGAMYLESKISKKTRFRMGIGLACAGSVALYALPTLATVATVTALGMGARLVTASAAYVGIKKSLDKILDKEKEDEDGNIIPSKLRPSQRKMISLAGAIGAASVGELVGGQLVKPLGDLLQEYFPEISQTLADFLQHTSETKLQTTSPAQIPADPASAPSLSTSAPTVVESVSPSPASVAPPIPIESMSHTVKPGDSLWSIVKSAMQGSNFEGFNGLSTSEQNNRIVQAFAQLPSNPKDFGIVSGNINNLNPGDVIDLSRIFKK